MSAKVEQIEQEALCINTEKVYDWILGESTGSTTILAESLPVQLPADAIDVAVECKLTDAEGTPIPMNAKLSVTEVGPRQDRQFEIDDNLITLQRVIFRKTLFCTIVVTGVDSATGTPFSITSNPVSLNFIETAYLCAPTGTMLSVRLTDFNSLTTINRNETGSIIDFGVQVFVCQSIQTVAPVTAQMTAGFCMPREPLTEQCGNVAIPPQCPIIFPGS
ncbi:MAG: hypothetical protein GX974_09520 [Clostridiales bacterium]|nr:hypothetical protein [Clostridiales bacterium]